MARVIREFGEQVLSLWLSKGERQARFTGVDWEAAYTAAPHQMAQIAASLEPTFAGELGTDTQALGPCFRGMMEKIEALMNKIEPWMDRDTGLFTDEAMQRQELQAVVTEVRENLDRVRVELKVVVDNLSALIQAGKPMIEYVQAAQSGDRAALLFMLSLNPSLNALPLVQGHIQTAVANHEHEFIRQIADAIEQRPPLRKHNVIGLILLVLWEAGLKKLPYKQIRGFLKEAGCASVPSHEALERAAQRLGLKKYAIETPRDRPLPLDESPVNQT